MTRSWQPQGAGIAKWKMVGRGHRGSNIPFMFSEGGVIGVMGVDGMDTLWLSAVVGLAVLDIARCSALSLDDKLTI